MRKTWSNEVAFQNADGIVVRSAPSRDGEAEYMAFTMIGTYRCQTLQAAIARIKEAVALIRK